MTTFAFPALDLRKLNSLTKYPSILTYHTLGDGGCLADEVQVPFAADDDCYVSEKCDGANARLIFAPGSDWFIGSREELLYARGDRVPNPMLGIVEAVRGLAEQIDRYQLTGRGIVTYYCEVYGAALGGQSAKTYGSRTTGVRFFDCCRVSEDLWPHLLDGPLEKIASWRDHGGQKFLPQPDLEVLARTVGVMLVPALQVLKGGALPTTLASTHAWLRGQFGDPARPGWDDLNAASWLTVDEGATGRPEGVVVRNRDRSRIAKLRFEDYFRTERRRVPAGQRRR